MNLTLWIVTGLLAVAYLIGGGGKLIMPKEKIAAITPSARWVEDFNAGSVKAIGALEVLAAVGLVLPAALDIAPVLVPLAALGLVMIMVGAVITRIRRYEAKFMVGTWSISPWPASWRGAAWVPSPSPVDRRAVFWMPKARVDWRWEATHERRARRKDDIELAERAIRGLLGLPPRLHQQKWRSRNETPPPPPGGRPGRQGDDPAGSVATRPAGRTGSGPRAVHPAVPAGERVCGRAGQPDRAHGHPPRWVPDESGGHRGQMAVLVKPNGRFGSAYMAAIKPLRYLFVVPALLRTIEGGWQAVQTGRAQA